MAYSSLVTKLERAVRAYIVGQGVADPSICFISTDSRDRTLNSITVQVPTFTKIRPMRPEGWADLGIYHTFAAAVQPTDLTTPQGLDTRRLAIDAQVGATESAMAVGDDQSLEALADAITAAGRALAFDPNNGSNPVTAANAANNADMVYFRCDEVTNGSPSQTRGDNEAGRWVEILHYRMLCSHAST